MFDGMMKALFKEEGASLRVEILEDPSVQSFIDTHAGILDSAFKETQMSDVMRRHFQASDRVFSGFKTFHELNESFPQLLDENGNRKPFERFLNDVRQIDDTYNRRYLNAEYNFAQTSAEMAGRWEEFDDDDRYYLQYRTQQDDKVRPEHAELEGITLPKSDSFWDEYYPPNGWNCRCTVVEVRKDKYRKSNHEDAMARGARTLQNDKKGMFKFNPGKEQKTFPDYNPYTISKCKGCDKAQLKLASIPSNQECQACSIIMSLAQKESTNKLSSKDAKKIRMAANKWADEHLPEVKLDNGQKAKRLIISNGTDNLVVNKSFFSETFAKNIHSKQLSKTMSVATKIEDWLPSATLVRKEVGKHHPFDFNVYEVFYEGETIECKTKDLAEKIVYTMRIKNKD